MKRSPLRFLLILAAFLVSGVSYGDIIRRPRLIVTIVIDQFRADYLTRFQSAFLPASGKKGEVGGFQYLMQKGAYYPLAEYSILQSMTCPGHATVLSGSLPYQNGIPTNDWYDHEKKRVVYCADGDNPKNLLGTTLGDELKNSDVPSKTVSIALKDRSSIFMGGHRADIAIWFNPKDNRWTTSPYYLKDESLPTWIQNLNQTVKAGAMDRLASPEGLELTEEAAEKAVTAYQLGKGKGTDLLAISFSSHDFVGHRYGPNDPLIKEMTIAEDRLLAKFFSFLQKNVPGGLSEVVIVLTGDHGVPPAPHVIQPKGIDAGRIDERLIAENLSDHLTKRFGKPSEGKWILSVIDLNFYLNRAAIQEKDLKSSEVERAAKEYIEKMEGVSHVFSLSDYRAGLLPPGMHRQQILNTYFPGRSGDLVAIPRPFYISGISGKLVTAHTTGYSYDRTVPIIFAGLHIKPGMLASPAKVIDIAPTLSFLTGIVPPSLSEGRVLSEIIEIENKNKKTRLPQKTKKPRDANAG